MSEMSDTKFIRVSMESVSGLYTQKQCDTILCIVLGNHFDFWFIVWYLYKPVNFDLV